MHGDDTNEEHNARPQSSRTEPIRYNDEAPRIRQDDLEYGRQRYFQGEGRRADHPQQHHYSSDFQEERPRMRPDDLGYGGQPYFSGERGRTGPPPTQPTQYYSSSTHDALPRDSFKSFDEYGRPIYFPGERVSGGYNYPHQEEGRSRYLDEYGRPIYFHEERSGGYKYPPDGRMDQPPYLPTSEISDGRRGFHDPYQHRRPIYSPEERYSEPYRYQGPPYERAPPPPHYCGAGQDDGRPIHRPQYFEDYGRQMHFPEETRRGSYAPSPSPFRGHPPTQNVNRGTRDDENRFDTRGEYGRQTFFPEERQHVSTRPTESSGTHSSQFHSTKTEGNEHENRRVMAEMNRLHLDDMTEEDMTKFGVKKNQRRMVFIGITGAGKSSTGNTILGEGKFVSRMSLESITKKCKSGEANRFDKNILLVDTPGLFDTALSNEDVSKEIARCVTLTTPGPHIFIIVIKFGRFTPQDVDTVSEFEKRFGKRLYDYAIVLFTGRDEIDRDGITLSEFVQKAPQGLKDLLTKCGNRYIAFNNRADETTKNKDVRNLLDITEQILKDNGGKCYTNEMYEAAERDLQQKMEAYKQKKREEKERKEKAMEDKLSQKYQKLLEETEKKSWATKEEKETEIEALTIKLDKEKKKNKEDLDKAFYKDTQPELIRPAVIKETAEKGFFGHLADSVGSLGSSAVSLGCAIISPFFSQR